MKSFRCGDSVKRIEAGADGLYPLIENLYQAYVENIQNGLIVGDFPT
jgi:hypothetical protein